MTRKNIELPEIPCGDRDILKFMLKALYGRERDDLVARLIERFGDARGVFIATHEELMSVRGVTERVATFFNVIYPFKWRVALDALPDDLTDERALDGFASALLSGEPYAAEIALYLDGDGALICAERLPKSELIRAAVAGACRHDAQKLVWISNIPSGRPRSPSEAAARARTAVKLKGLLDILGVRLIGRIEFSGGGCKRFSDAPEPSRDVRLGSVQAERSADA